MSNITLYVALALASKTFYNESYNEEPSKKAESIENFNMTRVSSNNSIERLNKNESYNEEPSKKVGSIQDFNMTRFAGFWYLVQSDGTGGDSITDETRPCPIYDVFVDKNNVLRMRNYMGGGRSFIQDNLNSFKFRFIEPDNHREMEILATDYRSYAVFYSWWPIKSDITQTILIYARTPEPFTPDINRIIEDVLKKRGLGDHRSLLSWRLKLCEGIQMVGRGKDKFRDPTANEDRAYCKPVKGVENFDLNRFMGPWYAMQSSLDRTNCGPSQFSLVENGKRLHLWSGYYELNRKDAATFWRNAVYGTFKDVEFYTVLETDYDSYAVLYQCTKQLAPSEIITLARKNELTDDFRTKVDNALSKVKDLGITYLFVNSQSNCKD